MPIQILNAYQIETEVINPSYNIPVILYCFTDTCAPCKAMYPHLDYLSTNNKHFIIKKINTATNQQFVTHYRIQSVPTLLLFWNGQLVRRSGFLDSQGKVIAFANVDD